MAGPDPIWTAEAVVRGMRVALTAATSASLFRFIVDRARNVLGEHSADYTALFLRASWQHSQGEPRSRRAAERVAAALTADGIAMPPALGGQIRADSGESGAPVE
jgi:predicted acyl esterase